MKPAQDVTQLLIRWKEGDEAALEGLVPIIYQELRRLARSYLRREKPGHTLQPTALVHEAFIRLINQEQASWTDRSHFFGIAARIMRQILIAHARRRQAFKRGGGVEKIGYDDATVNVAGRDMDLIALDEALQILAEMDPRQSRIIELRFFAGLTIDETAEVLGCSAATVSREWNLARTWLYHQIYKDSDES